MRRLLDRRRFPTVVAALALFICGWVFVSDAPAGAQGSAMLQRRIVKWFGPFAITPNDTARFNYTNLGIDTVLVNWEFTNALSGEPVCGNVGKAGTPVAAGMGAIWDFSQTIETQTLPDGTMMEVEVPHCDAGMLGSGVGSNETYFDMTRRHQMVAWIFIRHATPSGERQAVDLPTVEIFNSMMVMSMPGDTQPPDPTRMMRSMTFGRTIEVIHANPTAPGDALAARMALQPAQ